MKLRPEYRRVGDQPLADALQRWLGASGYGTRAAVEQAAGRWRELAGEDIARHTTRLYYRRGTLYVRLDSAVWRQELAYQQQTILQRLNEAAGKPVFQALRLE
jgi:predicted nucleic acid-binding Zn ribbon protein